jgi:hypothetical protein
MTQPISRAHHYVPQWYQKRFLSPGTEKLWRLEFKPEIVRIDDKRTFTRRAERWLYPSQSFYEDDLYSLRFGSQVNDGLEKAFFGSVDEAGCSAATFFEAFDVTATGLKEAFHGLVAYIAAQRFRTPRGLDWIKRGWGAKDQNQTLVFGACEKLPTYTFENLTT